MTATRDGTGEVGVRNCTGEEAKPVRSLTDTDSSVPDLDKIRFDDNIVSITDPTLPKKNKSKDKKISNTEGKGDSSPPEAITTAETFELGRNSEELILVAPDLYPLEQGGIRFLGRLNEAILQRSREHFMPDLIATDKGLACLRVVRENALRGLKRHANTTKVKCSKREKKQRNSNKRKGRRNEKAKKKKRTKAEGELKPGGTEVNDNFIPDDEPCIRIGDRLFSREETTRMLQRLNEMKNEDSSARRRVNNFNHINSCRSSKIPSPRTSKLTRLSKGQAKPVSVPRKEPSFNRHMKESRPHAGAEVESARLSVENAKAKTDNTLENQPRISIGNQLISQEETAHFLERLDEMKGEGSSEKRRISKYSYVDSTRASALPSPGSAQGTPRHAKEVNKLPSGVKKDFKKRSLNNSKEVKPYVPRPNYHRIMSCRTSKSSSPQKTKGVWKKRVRVGDHFMTVEEAQDLLQRYLKESSIRGRRRPQIQSKEPITEVSGSAKKLKVKAKNRPRAVAVLEPPKGEDSDCNFSHLQSVIKTEDEVTSLLLSIIVGAILLVGVCMIIGRQAQK